MPSKLGVTLDCDWMEVDEDTAYLKRQPMGGVTSLNNYFIYSLHSLFRDWTIIFFHLPNCLPIVPLCF